MFRRKRTNLVRKLWKLRKSCPHHGQLNCRACENSSSGEDCSISNDYYFIHLEDELKSVVASLFKRLKDHQLETLTRSVESRGGVDTDCILLSTEQVTVGKRTVSPALKFCQFFRFPELNSTKSLKTLVCCHHGLRYSDFKCANPYHYSRIVADDSPPPPYSPHTDQEGRILDSFTRPAIPEIRANAVSAKKNGRDVICPLQNDESYVVAKSIHRSFSTSSSLAMALLDKSRCKTWPPRSESSGDSWCKLAYWELRNRVGRLFEVTQICCNVFWALPQGGGFCLSLIDDLDPTPEAVERVRRHIGYGFQLTLEDDGIWIYNRSDYALFASSPSIQIEALNPKLPLVKRVPPGHSLRVFDYEKIKDLRCLADAYSSVDGPIDFYNVRVSFAKGWGANYTRRFITSCPSWIEIYINEKFVAKL